MTRSMRWLHQRHHDRCRRNGRTKICSLAAVASATGQSRPMPFRDTYTAAIRAFVDEDAKELSPQADWHGLRYSQPTAWRSRASYTRDHKTCSPRYCAAPLQARTRTSDSSRQLREPPNRLKGRRQSPGPFRRGMDYSTAYPSTVHSTDVAPFEAGTSFVVTAWELKICGS